jgi:hypothetical protein
MDPESSSEAADTAKIQSKTNPTHLEGFRGLNADPKMSKNSATNLPVRSPPSLQYERPVPTNGFPSRQGVQGRRGTERITHLRSGSRPFKMEKSKGVSSENLLWSPAIVLRKPEPKQAQELEVP